MSHAVPSALADRPLRFLTMADTPADPNSGASGTVWQTVRALRQLGHSVVDVWADDLGRRVRHGNLHYALEAPRAFLRVVKERLRASPFDIVLASQPHGYPAARWVARHQPATAFVNRSHGWEAHVTTALAPFRARFGVPAWRGMRAIPGRLLQGCLTRHSEHMARACHGIIVGSTLDKAFILNAYAIDPASVLVVPNAASDEYREAPVPQRDHHATPSVLLVGHGSFVKGVDVAIAVLNALAGDRAEHRATWVTSDGAASALVSRLSPAARARMTWIGSVSQHELRSIYDQHDLLLFPSFYEGFGKAFIEAMARGLCVVASDVGGMHDVIRSGRDGFLCAPGDVGSFTSVVRRLIDDPVLRATTGAAARETAARYSWSGAAEQIVEFCRRRLDARTAGRR